MIKSSKIYKKIAKVIDAYKELVDIESYSTPIYSEYGDFISQTTSTIEDIPALFSNYSKENSLETEGVFEPGKVKVYFKGDQTGLVVGSTIVRDNGERWVINKVSSAILNVRNMAQEVDATIK
jgi:hypothetical protein